MKHLLLAGLIGMGGALWMGGCSVEDTVNDIIGTNAIYVVNGTAGTIRVSVTDKNDKYIDAQNEVA